MASISIVSIVSIGSNISRIVITSSLPPSIVAAFIMLTLAVVLLWASRVFSAPARRVALVWIVPAALALMFALFGGLIDFRGLAVLLLFATACIAANRFAFTDRVLPGVAAHAIMLAIGVGLFLHVMPGIDNPRVVTDAVLGAGAMPYSKYLNFDKGMAGLFLLGFYLPDRLIGDELGRHVTGLLWRFAIVVAIVMALSLAAGYVRWDPKLPVWWPLWTWSMVVLTAMPEEAVFRGLALGWIARGIGIGSVSHSSATPTPTATPTSTAMPTGTATATATVSSLAIVGAGLLFGLAHFAGGPMYVMLATVAGIGYGWVYASTRSIGAAILTHAGVNTIHFFFFTYPALAQSLVHSAVS